MKYACHNRPPFKPSTELRDHHDRLVSSWPAVMNPACQFTHTDLGQTDPRCEGCKWRVRKGQELHSVVFSQQTRKANDNVA